MEITLRSFALVLAGSLGLAASAQQQYPVTVYGVVSGCTGNTVVNITTMPNTWPAIDINVPVQAPNCTFFVTLTMSSQGGGFVVSTPCLGAIQSQTVQYQINPGNVDSAMVSVIFNCGSNTADCLGVPGGSALPGSACATALGQSGVWSADCTCETNALVDCEGVPNGPAMSGTPCTNPATGMTGTWSPDCICVSDTTGGAYDCLGVLNGSNLPGTPCWTPGTNFIGTWDASCNCSNGNGLPCQAGFWVIQAYGQDSLPVPNEVWVWNLSNGNGALTYLWNFGDGTTSTDPYPTHTYSQNGPYLLCLTIADASGCTSTTCDTISINEDGLLNGMVLEGHVELAPARTDGFTLNIQNPITTSMGELQDLSHAAIWPNPSNGGLNLALLSVADGPVGVSFFDVNGREVRQESRTMNAGRSQHLFDITDLPSGIYTLRATDRNGRSLSIRFVKAA